MVIKNQVMTTEDVRQYLQISQATLIKEIKSGKLKARKIGRQYRILSTDLENYLKEI